MERTTESQTATPLELFFDLVFVFALTQVTAFMADEPTSLGVVQGMLILGLLWWAWVGYAWLGNLVRMDEGLVRLVIMAAMTVMFLVALAIPEAFHDLEGGLHGPLVIAVCYFAFRLTHLLLFWVYAKDDPGLRRQLVRFAFSFAGSAVFLTVAAFQEGAIVTVLWAMALASDYVGTFLAGASGWRLRAPGHFAERHGLIVIVALGESIVAIGIGASELPIAWPVVLAGVAGLALSAGLWWLYFDVSAIHGERALAEAPDAHRSALARDAYSFLHLPIMAGVVLLALGMKKALEYVGDTEKHDLGDPLTGVALAALFGGVAIYLLGHVGFKLRTVRRVSTPRLVLVACVVAAGVLAGALPALAQLSLLAALVWGLVTYETMHYREERHRLRHGVHAPHGAHEA
jgi:low temperature requirement protein LtrA